MAIEGSLQELSLPALVQLIIQEGGQAHIQIENGKQNGHLYLDKGDLCHVVLTGPGAPEKNTVEEVFYELLSWQEGNFVVEQNVPPPDHTVEQGWDFLLMEGLRQLDENRASGEAPSTHTESVSEMLAELSDADAQLIQELISQQETETMASKSKQIQTILNSVVNDSMDIKGAVVVDNDGLLLASVLSGDIDGNRVAAVSAGLISLATRSAQQLGQGEVTQTLIQAKQGNIIAIRAGAKAAFVALTSTEANLGMAFLECRDAAETVEQAL